MRRYHSDIYEYKHNNEIIYVTWNSTIDDEDDYKITYSQRICFTYKDIEVIEFYDKNQTEWYNVAEFMCSMIDKLGKERFKQFKEYYDKYKRLEEKYIIVNNNVYKPYIDDSCRSGNLIYYIIIIKMEDGESLDGRSGINQRGMNPFYNEKCNKEQQINLLKSRVKGYYEDKKILPKGEYLQKEETERYKKIIEWFKENNIINFIK